jgi:hypothetical protein
MIEISDQEIRAWLLHRLDAARGEVLERQLFTDASLAERIEGTLDDLLDDCAQGRLNRDEEVVLRARAGGRLGFARALARIQPRAGARPVERLGRRRAAWIALAAAVALAVATSLQRSPVPPQHVDQVGAGLPVFSLLADARRSAGAVLELPHHDGDVRLQLEIAAGRPEVSSYRLTVAEGSRTVFVATGLASRSSGPYRFVEAVVPALSLGPSSRTISLAADAAAGVLQPMEWQVQMAPP